MNLKTRVRSTAMRQFSSAKYQEKQRRKARKQRQKNGSTPAVHYFHQVDDPYSHLAVQKLNLLKDHYKVDVQTHLVSSPKAAYLGSESHYEHWARKDAMSIAADYETQFAPKVDAPALDDVAAANQTLAQHLQADDFAEVAVRVGEALWNAATIDAEATGTKGVEALTAGTTLRSKLGHYQGAMFYFEGEWYWGIDRLRLLEERLIAEGLGEDHATLCVPEPTPIDTTNIDASQILLEYFPSLRSPYTAIGHDRVLALIARSGVQVEVRPVMPMLMRGIPAPREKQRYIITDSGREARAHNVPFGKIVDPFGEPVKRAFALFPGAAKLGSPMAFVTAYLSAAWFDGIDITAEDGLRQVVANAGLNWDELQQASEDSDWEAILQTNLDAMLSADLWGVPSFRVSGGNAEQPYACWGQDRIWRVENEIARRA